MSDSFAPPEANDSRAGKGSTFSPRAADGYLFAGSSGTTARGSYRPGSYRPGSMVVGARCLVALICASALLVGHFAPAFARALILF